MDDKLVAVRVLHDGHPTARRLEGLGRETNMSIFQALDRVLEIFDLKRRARSLIGRRPLFADVRDRERILADGILDPFSAHHFVGNFEIENTFIKFARPLYVRHRNADKSDCLDFHCYSDAEIRRPGWDPPRPAFARPSRRADSGLRANAPP